jgi:hypothetical protein
MIARLLRRIRDLFRAPTPDTGLDDAAPWITREDARAEAWE